MSGSSLAPPAYPYAATRTGAVATRDLSFIYKFLLPYDLGIKVGRSIAQAARPDTGLTLEIFCGLVGHFGTGELNSKFLLKHEVELLCSR